MKIASRRVPQTAPQKTQSSEVLELMGGTEKAVSDSDIKHIEQIFENIRRQLGIKQP